MASMTDDQYVIARLDSLNTWPWPLSLLVIIGIGYFFDLYDVLTLGVAAPYMGPQLGVSPVTLSSIGSMVVLIGYTVGALLYAHIADTVGRKTGLLITLLTYSVGSILTAVSTSVLEVYIWRFITGLGIGAELSIAAAYLSEMAPA
ncbi:MAG: MFS transporter, partial [Nitrososphaeria archaeon]